MTTVWASLVLQERGGDLKICAIWILASAAGFLTHYFFLFPWMAVVAFLFLQPARFTRQKVLFCMFLVALLILPWYSVCHSFRPSLACDTGLAASTST